MERALSAPLAETREYIGIALRAAELAETAADIAMKAACRSGNTSSHRLEEAMHVAHQHACEAEKYGRWARDWRHDGVDERVVEQYARRAVDAAGRAQNAAGVELTTSELRAALQALVPEDVRERLEVERRRWEVEYEAAERAATGMDERNRIQAACNQATAEEYVPLLGWAQGHLRVMQAAASGRLYRHEGRTRLASQTGVWEGGRRISRPRTQELYAAGFLAAVPAAGRVQVVRPSPAGATALALVELHPAGLYETDRQAYEARYVRAARSWMNSDGKKAAARRLPPLDDLALLAYRRPVTLDEQAEQAARLDAEATECWESEGGYCPGIETPRPAPGPGSPTVAAQPVPGPQRLPTREEHVRIRNTILSRVDGRPPTRRPVPPGERPAPRPGVLPAGDRRKARPVAVHQPALF
ncbi:hypothetical protein G3M53_08070 [Streptomyces sp. SID7982]|nr:hypothetical protein [Streptomyces sp. SID7982]